MSNNRGKDKEDVVYIYIKEYYPAIKRNEIVPFAEMWMDLETVIQSKVRKRKTNIIYINAYMWNLEKWYRLSIFAKEKWRHRCRQQTYGYQAG